MGKHDPTPDQERLLLEEQMREYAEYAAGREDPLYRQQQFEELALKTPPPLLASLRRFLDAPWPAPRSIWDRSVFFGDVERLGWVRAVLYNINQDDADHKERQRGGQNRLPDSSVVWPAILYALENEDDYWSEVALKWVSAYAPAPEVAIELLTKFVRKGSALAALELSELAPDTPGLVEILTGSLRRNWIAPTSAEFDSRTSWPDMAAAALARLGPQAIAALPELREASLSRRRDGVRQWTAFEAYTALCGDESDVLALLDEIGQKGEFDQSFFGPVVRLARHKPVFLGPLCRLMRTRGWIADTQASRPWYWAGFNEAVCFLSEQRQGCESILPALAVAMEVDSDDATRAVSEFLSRLGSAGGELSQEDSFVVRLRGAPAGDIGWRIYADWLEEHGNPCAELLRLRHVLAGATGSDDAGSLSEFLERRDEWLSAYGGGWNELYDVIARCDNAD